MNGHCTVHPASFRDPAGQMAYMEGRLLRLVDISYRRHYDFFLSSGLCSELLQQKAIIPFEDVTGKIKTGHSPSLYKILAPEQVRFISYPYEWCFSQLREAALLTLGIQKKALQHGMTLKDASAYNIQFHKGSTVHIDTISFECYEEGKPWNAYHQFCQHFLAPLALMSLRDVSAIRLFAAFHDGIPLDCAAAMLGKAWIKKPSLYAHIILHARMESRKLAQQKNSQSSTHSLSKAKQLNLIAHLESLVSSLHAPKPFSHWNAYTSELPYSTEEHALKRSLIERYCQQLRPTCVWDMGANSGEFSRIAAAKGADVTALEGDHATVEKMLAENRNVTSSILPLWMNLLAPSPSCGWAHSEHHSLAARGPADLMFCLALTHHLAIHGQAPFERQAAYFASLAKYLVVEFIAPEDPNAARMLSAQPSLAPHYTQAAFEQAFLNHFTLAESQVICPGKRILYLYRNRTIT